MRIRDSFHPYAAVTILFWSLAYVLTRLALRYFSSFSLGFLRYFVASCALAAIAALTKIKPPKRADLLWFLAAGASGFFLYMIAFNQGQARVTAATGSVVIATVPVITALLARVVCRENLRPLQWAAILVEFAGVTVLALLDGAFSLNAGLCWLLLAALLLSVYNLLQRRLTKTYTALQTTTYSIFAGTLMLAVFLPASVREVSGAPGIQFVYLTILGEGVFQSGEDFSGQQLHVPHALPDQPAGIPAGRGGAGPGHADRRGGDPAGRVPVQLRRCGLANGFPRSVLMRLDLSFSARRLRGQGGESVIS